MSFEAICCECGNVCGYWHGMKGAYNTLKLNETENCFGVSKVEGDCGCTYDETKLTNTIYICKKCIENKLPNIAKKFEEFLKK